MAKVLTRPQPLTEEVYCDCAHAHSAHTSHDGTARPGGCNIHDCDCWQFNATTLYPVVDLLLDRLHYWYQACGCPDCPRCSVQAGRSRITGQYEIVCVIPDATQSTEYRRATYWSRNGWNEAARKLIDGEPYLQTNTGIRPGPPTNPWEQEGC